MRISLLTLAVCACSQARFVSNPDPHSSDLGVYRAVLDSMSFRHGGKQASQLVVIDSSFTVQTQDLGFDKLPRVDGATISDFEKRNTESRSLRYLSTPGPSVPIVLVSRKNLQSFLHDGPEPYWIEFYRRYPGSNGSTAFSSIGYSADGSVALLVLEHECASLCGELSDVVVRRESGRWHVVVIQVKEIS